MNTDILSIDPIIIEEMPEEPTTLLISENETILHETMLPLNHRFGIVDLWKIRSTKRHFVYYR